MSGYDPHNGAMMYGTVSVAIVWTLCQKDQVYMLVVNKVAHVPQLQNHLLLPGRCA